MGFFSDRLHPAAALLRRKSCCDGTGDCTFFRLRILPALLVYLAFALSQAFLYHGHYVPSGWFAYGVILAFFLLDGSAALPSLFVGTILGVWLVPQNLPPSAPPFLLKCVLVTITLAVPGASAAILRTGRRPLRLFLSHVRDILPILVHALLIGSLAALLWAPFALPHGMILGRHGNWNALEIYVLWLFQQSIGVILLTPLLLRHFAHPAPFRTLAKLGRRRPLLLLEELAIYAAVPLVALFTLLNPWGSHLLSSFYTILLFALLVWAAARFGFRGTLVVCLLRALFTLVATRYGHAIFTSDDPLEQGISNTVYVTFITGISLCVGMIFEERRNLILRLTESEGRLHMLLHHSPLPITIKDLKGRHLFVNPAAETSFGAHGQNLPEIPVPPTESDALALSTRRPVRVEETFPGRDGIHHYSTTKFPLLDQNGVPHAVCSMSIDITELQRMERERDRFFILAPDLFCVLRFDGRIVRANPAFLRFNGLAPEELPHKVIHDLAHPVDLPLSHRHFNPGAESRTAEIRWRHPHPQPGVEWDRVLSWTVFADHQTQLLFASGRDVSERKRDERTLLEAIETADKMAREADDANRSKTSFLAVMTHELRTPLNGVLGAANLLETTDLDSEQSDYVRIMTNCGESLQRLVTDILDFAKSEAGRIVMAEESFDVRAALDEVVSTLSPAAAKKNIALFLVCPPLPSPLLGDALRLRQVLLNLAGNAVKFSDQGRVIIRAMAEKEEAYAVRLRFEVEDSGPGIAPEAIPLLFKPFSQADASPTRSHGGAGLGLAISKNLVELMAGEIGVTSEPGKGSLFHFTARFRRDREEPGPGVEI